MPWHYARHAQPAKSYYEIDYRRENEALDLGPDGKTQAIQLAHRHGPFQVIAHSPFVRAASTASIVHVVQGARAELISLPNLREVNFGCGTDEALQEWIDTGNSPGGEPVVEARQRVQSVVRELLRLGIHVDGLVAAHKLLYLVILLEEAGLALDTPVAALGKQPGLGYAECVALNLEILQRRIAGQPCDRISPWGE